MTNADAVTALARLSLLKHALARCIAGAALIGGRAVVVHAIDPEAARFWRRWGFLPARVVSRHR
jgi:hypothetical protein